MFTGHVTPRAEPKVSSAATARAVSGAKAQLSWRFSSAESLRRNDLSPPCVGSPLDSGGWNRRSLPVSVTWSSGSPDTVVEKVISCRRPARGGRVFPRTLITRALPHSQRAEIGIRWLCMPHRQLAPPLTVAETAICCCRSARRGRAHPRALTRGTPPQRPQR